MKPAQIRAQLKRFKGLRLAVRAIARVLRSHGYELTHRGGRPQEEQPPTHWDAPHRNALWQVDLKKVRLPQKRRTLGTITRTPRGTLSARTVAPGWWGDRPRRRV